MGPRLSPRLRAVAEHVVAGKPVVDVGTDHAHLAVHLAASGRVPRVMAIECRVGPMTAAAATLRRFQTSNVELRLAHGLRGLTPGAFASIVIAGMGGRRIQSIVEDRPAVAAASERLILQPNTEWAEVRHWLADRGWPIVAEQLVTEGRRTYLVMAVDPRTVCHRPLDTTEQLLGFRPSERDPAVDRWLKHESTWRRRVLSRMREHDRNADRIERLRRELALLDQHAESTPSSCGKSEDAIP